MTKKHILLTCILFLFTIGVWADDWQHIDSIPRWANTKLNQMLTYGFTPFDYASNLWSGTRNEFIKWDKEAVELLDLLYKIGKSTLIWAYNNNGNVLVVSTNDRKNYTLIIVRMYQ